MSGQPAQATDPAHYRRLRTIAANALGGAAPASFAGEEEKTTTSDCSKTVALVATTMWRSSHAQHIADRFGMGFPRDGAWHRPAFRLVSIFVEQEPDGSKVDLAPLRAAEFGAEVFPSIAAALRRGGGKLAVDAVLIVGEHGVYPISEFGQIQYPRYEFLVAVTDVFRQDGRAVPVFSDKHLSYDWGKAVEMVRLSKELGFPFLAGSSLPCGYRMPALELPLGTTVEEAVCVTNLGGEGGWFHGMEVLQCMLERRAGGESGVRSVHATQGDAVWPILEAGLARGGGGRGLGCWEEGGVDPALLEACLSRSQQLRNVVHIDGSTPAMGAKPDGNRLGNTSEESLPMYSQRFPSVDEVRRVVESPHLIRVEYVDGTRAAVLVLSGLVGDSTFAARLGAPAKLVSCLFNNVSPAPLFWLSFSLAQTSCLARGTSRRLHVIGACFATRMQDTIAPLSFRNFGTMSRLMEAAEDMFETGETRWPIERNLMTTGLTAVVCEGLYTLVGPVMTPHLEEVRYMPR